MSLNIVVAGHVIAKKLVGHDVTEHMFVVTCCKTKKMSRAQLLKLIKIVIEEL